MRAIPLQVLKDIIEEVHTRLPENDPMSAKVRLTLGFLFRAMIDLDWTPASAKKFSRAFDRLCAELGVDPTLVVWMTLAKLMTGRDATTDELTAVFLEIETERN